MSDIRNPKNKPSRWTIPVILLTIFIDILGYGILIPIIPLLLTNPLSNFYLLGSRFTLTQGYILLGFLTASFSLFQFFSAPIFGQVSDKYGRKIVITISLLGTFISHLIFIFGIIFRNIPLLFLARSFDGITAGSIAASQAAIADVTPPNQRSRNFGYIGAAFGLGFIIGPFLGGKLSDPSVLPWFNATTPFYLAAIFSFLSVLSVMFLFKETLRVKNKKIIITAGQAVRNIVRALQLKNIRTILITIFFYQSGFAFFTTFFSVYLIYKFHFDQSDMGNVFSFMGLWMIFSQVLVVSLVAKRFPENKILPFSLVGIALVVFLLTLFNSSWEVYLAIPVFAALSALAGANSTAIVSRSATEDVQGEIMGINSSVTSLASGIPPIISGFIAARYLPQGSMIVASIVILFAGIVFYSGFRAKKKCEWTGECYQEGKKNMI